MKTIIRLILKRIISLIDYIIPKSKHIWVFYITPKTNWDANMQCVFALAKSNQSIECVIVHLSPLVIPNVQNIQCYSFHSFTGFCKCLRAGIHFFDHATVPGISRRNRININLWHGIPLKQIRYFCKGSFLPGYLDIQSKHTSLIISSSSVDRLAMIASFQIPPERVVVTGLPRNDLLSNPKKYLKILPHLQKEQNDIATIKRDKILILYAPTYRENNMEDALHTIEKEDEILLATILQKFNAILGIRDHPYSNKYFFPYLHENDFAVDISSKTISNTNILLNSVDVLITDYSSIWIDFLLLKRPILGYCPDLDAYLEERGFLYDFNTIFPGPITSTIKDLVVQIDHSLSNLGSEIPEKQKLTYHLFHKYNDGLNTQRVLDHVARLSDSYN